MTDPVGTIHIVDPSPLNWLFITWNTMEEPVRTDTEGHLTNSAIEHSTWLDPYTLELNVRRGVRFQDGETLDASSIKRAFDEVQRWKAPHPPGTYLNFHPEAQMKLLDDYTIHMSFPETDGLALAKFRGMHIASSRFWDEEGFGYRDRGSGEGHW